MGVEGFDGKLDDGGVSGSGDADAACCEDGDVVVVDLDVVQVGRLAASDEDAWAVLGFDSGDAVGIEATADVAHTQLFPHLDADGADVTDDVGDGQIAQNGDFRGDGGIPACHEIGQLVLKTRYVDLQTVRLVDEERINLYAPTEGFAWF